MADDTLFRALAAVAVVTMIGTSIYYRHRADREGGRVSRQEESSVVRIGLSLSGLLGFGGLLLYFIRPSLLQWTMVPLPAGLRWTGLALAFLSALGTVWIFRNLGTNVTRTVVARDGATLVTSGPYRFVRHPLYTNGALAFMALSLVTRSWWFAACVLAAFVLLVVRTRQEEANLEARFGEDWRRYAARTGRFLPRLVM
jgi:protein-S-isoprenylcysteine O-methyltransferase Ste14